MKLETKVCTWKIQVNKRLEKLGNPKNYVFDLKPLNECNKCKGYNIKCEGYIEYNPIK